MLLFAALVVLATAGARWGWVRGFGGDVLAVVWLSCVFRSAIARPVWQLAGAAFLCGTLVEFAQYVEASLGWHMPNRALRIVLGSTPDGWDVVAYGIGALVVIAVHAAWRAARDPGTPALTHIDMWRLYFGARRGIDTIAGSITGGPCDEYGSRRSSGHRISGRAARHTALAPCAGRGRERPALRGR